MNGPDAGLPLHELRDAMSRRAWLSTSGLALAALALDRGELRAQDPAKAIAQDPARGLHHQPRCKRVIWLFQAGGPSQFETLDDKPKLRELHGQPLPDSVRGGQRLTGMSGNQAVLKVAGSFASFARHGDSGIAISSLLPHTAKIADRICVLRAVHTEAINHDPAITFLCSGSQIAGRPSLGSWLSYGLGAENRDLPAFVVLVSKDSSRDQPLYSRLWSAGFLPSEHQGVPFRAGKDAVLFLGDPVGVARADRRTMLDALARMGDDSVRRYGDPEIVARVQQAELAFRMQTSVPEATDLRGESDATFARYGEGARDPGTYAANCLLARRLVERGVRFVQLFHQGWDQHSGMRGGIARQCAQTDQASAGLVMDLAERGLLDDTLVVFGGEFGRTSYCQGRMTNDDYGRDHHPRCFSMWMAGGGVRQGHVHGETDEFGYNVNSGGVHVHDVHATILHLLGVDHERQTFLHQGRRYRLTDVFGKVERGILA